jgi:outer membrane protein assembly factor BamB
VALDAASGVQKWVFHVGSRVDFSPALYKGLCIFSAKDGWVYGLDAAKGTLVWKLLINARERFIGGQEKLESLWPACGDVLVAGGVGYASSGFGFSVLGGVRAVAFKPETGEPVWGRCYNAPLNRQEKDVHAGLFNWKGEKGQVAMEDQCLDAATGALVKKEVRNRICPSDDCLALGNSLARNAEDRRKGDMADARLRGRTLAASADLTVAFTPGADKPVGRRQYGGELNLVAAKEPKQELWKSPAIELVVDDIVITPKQVYCVGHYERVKKSPELWVLSPADGKVLNTVAVDGLPAFNGMSAAGNRLFVATRDGKLICYQGK